MNLNVPRWVVEELGGAFADYLNGGVDLRDALFGFKSKKGGRHTHANAEYRSRRVKELCFLTVLEAARRIAAGSASGSKYIVASEILALEYDIRDVTLDTISRNYGKIEASANPELRALLALDIRDPRVLPEP